jgi:Skp family chaperone for outer membrane proteins
MFHSSTIRVLALGLGCCALISTSALAQTAGTARPAAGSAKVGILNIQEAIQSCNEGQKELAALNQRFTPKQNELKSQSDEIDSLTKQLEAQGAKLSDDERATRLRTLDTKKKAFQRNFDDAKAEYQQAEQDVATRIYQKMSKVLEKLSTDRGYSMVLDVSTAQSPVLWASPGTVITKDLIDAYNAEAPVAAAKPATSGTTTRPAGGTTTPKKP